MTTQWVTVAADRVLVAGKPAAAVRGLVVNSGFVQKVEPPGVVTGKDMTEREELGVATG